MTARLDMGERQMALLRFACERSCFEVAPGSTEYHAALKLQRRGFVRRQRENAYRYDVTEEGRAALARCSA